jgi:retron-type reverse transcriptase
MRAMATLGSGPLDGKRDLLARKGENRAPSYKEVFALPDSSGEHPAPDAVSGLREAAVSEQGLFFEIYATSFMGLYGAWRKTMLGKSHSLPALIYASNSFENLLELSRRLACGTYSIKGYRKFTVYEPKKREVLAIDFESKIVLHSLCDNILEPLFCRGFITDSYANQRGKGMHYGLERLRDNMRSFFLASKAREEEKLRNAGMKMPLIKDWNYNGGWIIKGDVRKYFYSIDHEILRKLVSIKLAAMEDKKSADFAFWMCDKIISSTPNPGIPIGNQTSQLFALLCLDGFDHYMKDELGLKYYGRYMDDFYIICRTKEEAVMLLKEIKNYMASLKLELNEKTQIFPLSQGIDFLGFHTYLTKTGKVIRIIRRKSKVNMKRKINKFRKLVSAGKMSYEDVLHSYTSWKSHAFHGNTRRLAGAMDKYFYSKFPELRGGGKENGKDIRVS